MRVDTSPTLDSPLVSVPASPPRGEPVGAFRREVAGGDDAVSAHTRRWAGWMIEVD